MAVIRKEHILNDVHIIDIAEEFSLDLEDAASGSFDFKCVCPSVEHKNGSERTGSLYINSEKNDFYCFGCCAGSNVIDFYMLCADVDFSTAIHDLKERVDPETAKNIKISHKPNNFSVLLKISNLFRGAMLAHPEDLKWINGIMKRTDEYIEDFSSSDVDKAKALYSKLIKTMKKRYAK